MRACEVRGAASSTCCRVNEVPTNIQRTNTLAVGIWRGSTNTLTTTRAAVCRVAKRLVVSHGKALSSRPKECPILGRTRRKYRDDKRATRSEKGKGQLESSGKLRRRLIMWPLRRPLPPRSLDRADAISFCARSLSLAPLAGVATNAAHKCGLLWPSGGRDAADRGKGENRA